MINLMYITKRPDIAKIAEEAGVDWIFVDMELYLVFTTDYYSIFYR